MAAERSPADAGLESGRYREIPTEDVAKWERDQDAKNENRQPASEQKPASANAPF